MDRLETVQIVKRNALTYHDVSDRVRSWGRRGILGGGLFGFAFGVVFVAIPQTVNVLTFGVVGTLLVAVVEGAVIAGAFGACAAALSSKDAFGGKAARSHGALPSGHRARNVGRQDGDIPLSAWPTRRTFPNPAAAHLALESVPTANTAERLQAARTQLGTLDGWENGNTGP